MPVAMPYVVSPPRSDVKNDSSAVGDYIELGDGTNKNDDLCINAVRTKLHENGEMAFGAVSYAALKHAAHGVTHTAETFISTCYKLRSHDWHKLASNIHDVISGVKGWVNENHVKAFLMFVGLCVTAFKAHTITLFITSKAQTFIDWSITTTPACRFCGFVVLMVVRLGISTLVPPTSPAFGIIIQAATPEEEKWTAMPFFLLASTAAGAFPYMMDKILQLCFGKDFQFTMCMKHFAEVWPLTCWTEPVMRQIFMGSGGGKAGATLAIIFAHAAPFMGAQTTCLQRFFLPHPLDTIISQPFGMSEDLISMAMAEARTNPALASKSLTAIIASFNLGEYFVFSKRADQQALVIALLNIGVGVFVIHVLNQGNQFPFVIVGVQLMIQMFFTPLISYITTNLCAPNGYLLNRSGASFERGEATIGTVGSLPTFNKVALKFHA